MQTVRRISRGLSYTALRRTVPRHCPLPRRLRSQRARAHFPRSPSRARHRVDSKRVAALSSHRETRRGPPRHISRQLRATGVSRRIGAAATTLAHARPRLVLRCARFYLTNHRAVCPPLGAVRSLHLGASRSRPLDMVDRRPLGTADRRLLGTVHHRLLGTAPCRPLGNVRCCPVGSAIHRPFGDARSRLIGALCRFLHGERDLVRAREVVVCVRSRHRMGPGAMERGECSLLTRAILGKVAPSCARVRLA